MTVVYTNCKDYQCFCNSDQMEKVLKKSAEDWRRCMIKYIEMRDIMGTAGLFRLQHIHAGLAQQSRRCGASAITAGRA